MPAITSIFKDISLEQIERDPNQPRKDFGTEGDENRLFVSIEEIGVRQPLAVSEIEPGRYIVLDGHRRYICAQRAGLKTVPCCVYPKLHPGEFERIRFEIQNNRRPWKPFERSESLNRIRESKGFKTNKELAAYLHMSDTLVGNSLQLRNVKVSYLELMERYGLDESYRVEFVRLQPKLKKIRNHEVDQIIPNIFERVQHSVIRNAKEFRKLGKIFLRASANEAELDRYLSDPDMTIAELNEHTLQSGFSLLIEELMQKVVGKIQNGIEYSSDERKFLLQFRDFLNKVL